MPTVIVEKGWQNMTGKKPTPKEMLEQARGLLLRSQRFLTYIIERRIPAHCICRDADFLSTNIDRHLEGIDFSTGAPF